MFKIRAGIATIEGKDYACLIKSKDGVQDFIELLTEDYYNGCEVDSYMFLDHYLDVDVESILKKIEKDYKLQ